jgi:hypothetical protein
MWKKQMGNKKGTLQSFKNSSWSTPSNFASFTKFDYSLHVPTRLEGFKHPTLGLLGQFLLTKIIWSRCLVCNR